MTSEEDWGTQKLAIMENHSWSYIQRGKERRVFYWSSVRDAPLEEGSISIVMEGSRQNYGTKESRKERPQLVCPPLLKSLANTFHWLNLLRRQFKGACIMWSIGLGSMNSAWERKWIKERREGKKGKASVLRQPIVHQMFFFLSSAGVHFGCRQ